MKKKGPRSIPDFSSKRKNPPSSGVPAPKAAPVVTPREPVVKPQATPAHLGRRGQ